MSAKMQRRRRHDRRKRVLLRRTEDSLFFGRGTIPPSSTGFAMCPCGARSFTRDAHGDLGDFDAMHAYCDDLA